MGWKKSKNLGKKIGAAAGYYYESEYGTLSQPERDYYYNREQAATQNGGPGWSKDQYKLAQAQYKAEMERQNRVGQINQWEQSRNPYYASLYQQKNQQAQAKNQQQYTDSMKRMQLQHAARGTIGGSQEQYNQAELGAARALRDSQAAQRNQDYVQGLRRGDQEQAQSLRNSTNQNAYTDALSKAMANSANIQGGGYAQMADLERMRMQDQQQYQNNMSQIYGQSINTGLNAGANYFAGSNG